MRFDVTVPSEGPRGFGLLHSAFVIRAAMKAMDLAAASSKPRQTFVFDLGGLTVWVDGLETGRITRPLQMPDGLGQIDCGYWLRGRIRTIHLPYREFKINVIEEEGSAQAEQATGEAEVAAGQHEARPGGDAAPDPRAAAEHDIAAAQRSARNRQAVEKLRTSLYDAAEAFKVIDRAMLEEPKTCSRCGRPYWGRSCNRYLGCGVPEPGFYRAMDRVSPRRA